MANLIQNNYGKSRVRMVKVSPDRRNVREVEVDIAVEGDFDDAHVSGNNANVLPTDTMKNTVYALGKHHPVDTIESFALHLARHLVDTHDPIRRARVEIASPAWRHLDVAGRAGVDAFRRDGGDVEACRVIVGADGTTVIGGVRDLVILKTTRSGFSGFLRDPYTTLADADDRLFGTSLRAEWMCVSPEVIFGATRTAVRAAMLDTFAEHDSLSVQQTLHAMAEAALAASEEIAEVRLSMPNRHNLLVDLSPFGLENDNEIFLPIDAPYGLIEATVSRR